MYFIPLKTYTLEDLKWDKLFVGFFSNFIIEMTHKSEQKMLNNFKRIFGNEKDVVVCFGDYEQKKQMKYKEANKGKGMRTLFRKAGFQTFLVDEFRTSCRCSKCEIGICKKRWLGKIQNHIKAVMF